MKPMQGTAGAERVTEFGGRMNELADDLRAKAEAAQQDLNRNIRRAKAKAGDLMEEGRHEIKERPLAAVSAFMLTGAVLGFIAGVLVGRKRCS